LSASFGVIGKPDESRASQLENRDVLAEQTATDNLKRQSRIRRVEALDLSS
jgi:hypothetical protein